jgi:hypothetical protein
MAMLLDPQLVQQPQETAAVEQEDAAVEQEGADSDVVMVGV